MFSSTPENSYDAARLVECLRSITIGETATFEQLSAAIGKPVQSRRYLLAKAMARLNAETGAVFASVFGVGYRRLPMAAVPTIGGIARRRVRRICKVASAKMSNASAKANDLPAPVALAVNRELAVLGLIQTVSREKVADKAAADSTDTSPAPVAMVAARLMEALR